MSPLLLLPLLLAGSLNFLLTDSRTDPPGEVVWGRLDAALRPGRNTTPIRIRCPNAPRPSPNSSGEGLGDVYQRM